MTTVMVTNNNDSWLEIIPLRAGQNVPIPDSLEALLADLPPGSFILKNKTTTPVTVIVVRWNFTDNAGNNKQLSIYCDAYLTSRVDPLINANDLSLITPDSCTRQEYWGRLKTQTFLGSPLRSPRNAALLSSKDSVAATQISVDSVIFANGQIWGPDTLHYYKRIMERGAVRQSVLEEVNAAKAAGEDPSNRLSRIQAEAASTKDKFSADRSYYAKLIQKSPNPDGTLRSLQNQAPLPEFHHVGEQQ